jgi:hypothetical protein
MKQFKEVNNPPKHEVVFQSPSLGTRVLNADGRLGKFVHFGEAQINSSTGRGWCDASNCFEAEPVTLEGVGFQCDLPSLEQNAYDQLYLKVGYAHPVVLRVPSTVSIQTGRYSGSPCLFMSGVDPQELGDFQRKVCKVKPASVYKKRGVAKVSEWLVPRKTVVKK